jgi:hypothetical protein
MRKDVAFANEQFQVSERRASKLLGWDQGIYRYENRGQTGMRRCKKPWSHSPGRRARIYGLYRAEGQRSRRSI